MATPDVRHVETYLVLEKDTGWMRPPRIVSHRKGKPSLRSGEIAIKLKIAVPMSMFDKFIPVVEAAIVDDTQVLVPEVTVSEIADD